MSRPKIGLLNNNHYGLKRSVDLSLFDTKLWLNKATSKVSDKQNEHM